MLRAALHIIFLVSFLYSEQSLSVQPNIQKNKLLTQDKAAELAVVGRLLFEDKRISADGTISCSSCHREELAFTDGLPLAVGNNNQPGTRNTPTLINVSFNQSFFLDGRRDTLEEQALDPYTNPLEHGLRDTNTVTDIVRNIPEYQKAFNSIFEASSKEITPQHIALAISEYERTIRSTGSPFDSYYFGHNLNAISDSAIRGFRVFTERAKCHKCHALNEQEALFTDHIFHSIGIGFRTISNRLDEITRIIASNSNSIDKLIISDQELSELGRFVVTLKPDDIGKFKTPTLRNIAITGPYMHDGSIKTLEEAINVEVYYRGLSEGRTLILTPQEKQDLKEFLLTLTDN